MFKIINNNSFYNYSKKKRNYKIINCNNYKNNKNYNLKKYYKKNKIIYFKNKSSNNKFNKNNKFKTIIKIIKNYKIKL
jgi:lipopolysaccharide export LptBFGC system permease protein LptF